MHAAAAAATVCSIVHTHTHNRYTRTQRRAHSLTRWRRNNCAIKKGWYEAEAHKLPAVRVRWLYNTQFSSGELCAASAPLSMYACAGNACVLCVCLCIAANCCGRAQARSLVVQNGAQGPVSEQRMMTDLLVRLFCHTHTCHNLPRLDCAALRCSGAVAVAVSGSLRLFFCCFCLVFVFRLFLRNVVVVVVVFARFVRLKFIWLWPKGDGL